MNHEQEMECSEREVAAGLLKLQETPEGSADEHDVLAAIRKSASHYLRHSFYNQEAPMR